MRRVLLVSDSFPPFNRSGSARPFFFAKYLTDFGYQPTVLSATPGPADPTDGELLAALDRPLEVLRTPALLAPLLEPYRRRQRRRAASGELSRQGKTPKPRQLPLSSRVLKGAHWLLHSEVDWSALATATAALHLRTSPPDLVWATGPHFRNLIVGHRLSRWFRCPLVVDLRDPWTYGSLWRPSSAVVAAREKKLATRILDDAAAVVFTSPLTLEEMARRFPHLDPKRLHVVTNGFEPCHIAPSRSLGPERCLFRYVGVLNDRRRPDLLIEAFSRSCRDPEFRSNAVLEFIGDAAGQEHKALGAPEGTVRFSPRVSRAESLRLMAGSDVNVLLQTITSGQDVISGKAFDYLQAGKPIVAAVDPRGGDAWLLREAGVGRVVAWDDVDGLDRALSEAYRSKGQTPIAPPASLQRFTRRELTRQLATVLDSAMAEASADRAPSES